MNQMTQRQKFVTPILVLSSLMLLPGTSQSQAQGVPGTYELSFFKVGAGGLLEPVSSLAVCTPSVCEELILGAHIEEESSQLPAQGGAVVFQYCSYKGLPPNDITRPDEAPTAVCDSGLATWKSLHSLLKVNESGDAYLDFGIVLIPRTVGFRFLYRSQGSNIITGMSDPKDFTWTP
jgi:hypothetical protein